MPPNYATWSKEDLIARLTELELSVKSDKRRVSPNRGRPFHFKKHPLRKIAVKFCYSGWEYNGLAHQVVPTPLPTVEDTLFKAFAKSRLVDPEGGLEGCGWERCGRTDVGVSAAGQVVSLWVRSALPGDSTQLPIQPLQRQEAPEDLLPLEPQNTQNANPETIEDSDFAFPDLIDEPPSNSSVPPVHAQHELRYASALNRALPPTIRVLAWSPVSPDFSARYNCQHRHYKYFFPSHGLDIGLLQQAASHLVGLHDFRNLSKLDPAKQITDFRRRIYRAEISPVVGYGDDQVYVFDLVGSAFLYHQVRHIMAVLFLVGAGLEPPSILPTLMNVDGTGASPSGPPTEIVDRKPVYQMADGLPLMLWDCAFADSDVQWQTDDDVSKTRVPSDLVQQLHSIYQRSLIHTTIEAHFLAAADQYHQNRTRVATPTISPLLNSAPLPGIPLGGGSYRRAAKYVPLLSRERLDHVEVANERWRSGKGSRRGERPDKRSSHDDDDE